MKKKKATQVVFFFYDIVEKRSTVPHLYTMSGFFYFIKFCMIN